MTAAITVTLSWLPFVLLAVASVFLFCVLALYFRGAFHHKIVYRLANVPTPDEQRFPVAMSAVCSSICTSGNTTGFYVGPSEVYGARLHAIRGAKRTIDFETFFYTPGRRADEFAAALIEKAKEGVRIRMVVDSSGSLPMSSVYWKNLVDAGIDVRFYNRFSLRSPMEFLNRNHRKLLIVDGCRALVGGTGVSDDWDGKEAIGDTGPWLDVEVQLEGPVVQQLSGVFLQQWIDVNGVADLGPDTFDACSDDRGESMLVTAGNSPSLRNSPLRALFCASVAMARRRIWIASPYFLPDREWRRVLLEAVSRGIDVRVLTTGVKVDLRWVFFASRELYPDLIKGGVKIYEYEPAMMHAKAVLIDDCWVSTGSANFDPRSFFNNEELNVSSAEPGLAQRFERLFLTAFARSQLMDLATWSKRPLKHKCIGKVALLVRSQL